VLLGEKSGRLSLARVGTAAPKVGKYAVDLPTFEEHVLPSLEPLPASSEKRLPPPDPLPTNPRLYTLPSGVVEAVSLLRILEEEVHEAGSPLADGSPPPAAGSPTAAVGSSPAVGEASPVADASPQELDVEAEAKRKEAIIYIPSSGKEERVEEDTLEAVPEGWRAPPDILPDEEVSEDEALPRLTLCDEVGKMGLLSVKFPITLNRALDGQSGSVVLGTLPQAAKGQRDHAAVEAVKRRSDARVFKITRSNRDTMVEHAFAALREGLGLGAEPQKAAAERKERNVARGEKRKRVEAAQFRRAEERAAKIARVPLKPLSEETPAERETALKAARKAARKKERAEEDKKLKAKIEAEAKKKREERKRKVAAKAEMRDLARSGKALKLDCADDSGDEVKMDDDAEVQAMGAPTQALDSDDEGLEATVVKAAPVRRNSMATPPPSPLPGASPIGGGPPQRMQRTTSTQSLGTRAARLSAGSAASAGASPVVLLEEDD